MMQNTVRHKRPTLAKKTLCLMCAAAMLFAGLSLAAPVTVYAAGGDFAIFGGSGGAGESGVTTHNMYGGAGSSLSAIGGKGGDALAGSNGGGGGGEAGHIDMGVQNGGGNGEDAIAAGGGNGGGTGGGAGNTSGGGGGNAAGIGGGGGGKTPGAGGNGGPDGGGGGGGAGDSTGHAGGSASVYTYAMQDTSYTSVAVEGGNGGDSGLTDNTGGGGGAGGGVLVTAPGNLTVAGNVSIKAGDGGASGGAAAGAGGASTLNLTGQELQLSGAFSLSSGMDGANTGNGTVGAGGAAIFSVQQLTAPAISLTKQDGAFSFLAGVLAVDADTTINVTGTALADVNITTVNVADGQTLTINNAGGALTIGTLNIYGTGNVVVADNANLSVTAVNVETGVALSAPTGTAVDKNTQNLVLAFNKTVTALQNGTLTLNDGTTDYTYTTPASPAIISGTGANCVATIPFSAFSPALTLAEGKSYTVSASADVFQFAYTFGALTGTQNNVANASVGSFTVAVTPPAPQPQPTENTTPQGPGSPQTGDNSNLPLWALCGTVALAGLGLCGVALRKRFGRKAS